MIKNMRPFRQLSSCIVFSIVAFWFGQYFATRAGAQQTGTEAAYRLQSGDALKIQVLNLPDLTADVKVRPDGLISVMLLDDLPAAGKTITEVREEITQGYAKRYRDPQVAVFPVDFSNRTVYVTGEVAKPGAVPLTAGLTAMSAVIEAGGLRPNSRAAEAVVLRHGDTSDKKVIPLHLDGVLKGSSGDSLLEPADIVYVPRSDIEVYVGGEVQKPGMIPLDGELTAFRAIALAGGFLETAKPNNAVVVRSGGDQPPAILSARLGEVQKGGADVTLKPWDIIYVPKSGIAKLDKVSDLFIRKLVPLTMTGGFSYVLGGFGSAGINCFQ